MVVASRQGCCKRCSHQCSSSLLQPHGVDDWYCARSVAPPRTEWIDFSVRCQARCSKSKSSSDSHVRTSRMTARTARSRALTERQLHTFRCRRHPRGAASIADVSMRTTHARHAIAQLAKQNGAMFTLSACRPGPRPLIGSIKIRYRRSPSSVPYEKRSLCMFGFVRTRL